MSLENTQNELSLTRSTAVLVDLKQDINERIIISKLERTIFSISLWFQSY